MCETIADKMAKEARDHAWDWFALHAAQRMQTFNYFLVATAFLIAAYGTLLEKHSMAAATAAIVGAWIAYWFTRLDRRTWQLVDGSQKALLVAQKELADRSGIPEIEIAKGVEKAVSGASKYRTVIAVVEWTMVAVFLAAAAYAIFAKSTGGGVFLE